MAPPIDLRARAVWGLVMSAVAIYAVIAGGSVFGAVVAIAAVGGLREWHRLINRGRVSPETIASALAVSAAVFITVFQVRFNLAVVVLATGAVVVFLWSAGRRQAPAWHMLGPIYVGLPAVALVLLRNGPSGEYLLLGIFVAVWTTDISALFAGRLIGGPKLLPRLSPNKTWAGFLSGTVAGGVAEAVYVALLHGNIVVGLAFGVAIGVIGHAGDLFESWVKRKFQAKDSGGLIPGHGGILDRIDSLLFVAPACALLVIFAGLNPI